MVLSWKHAGRVMDKKSGPKNPRSSVLPQEQEQVICEFRRRTTVSLDDVFISLSAQIPALTRSNVHRCLKRHGLNRLPVEDENGKRKKQKCKNDAIGFVPIDSTEIRLASQKFYLFVGIDRVCKYAYIELHERMTQARARDFQKNLVTDCPFTIHTILTDNGAQFTYALLAEHVRPKNKVHMFDETCAAHGIKHKLRKCRHPWTNGQVEAFNRKIKSFTTKRYHDETPDRLKKPLMAFLLAYHFQRPLQALKYQSPYDKIIEVYEQKPELFNFNPLQKTVGLNT